MSIRSSRVVPVLLLMILTACTTGEKIMAPPSTAQPAQTEIPAWTPPPPVTGAGAAPESPLATAQSTRTAVPVARSGITSTLAVASPTTGAPESSAVVTTTATLTLTATPTATPPPHAALEHGRWLQTIGDCDGARREFAVVVAERGATDDAVEARFRLAQCYLRDQAPAEATRVLEDLLASAPENNPYRAPATFLLGEAQRGLSAWNDAESSYRDYLALQPDLASFTWQRIGAVRQAAANLVGATDAYTKALTTAPDWINAVAIRRALAGVLSARGDGQGAAAQYDALRAGQTTGAWAAEMQWLAGSALADGHDRVGAISRWQAALAADLTSEYAHYALAALVDAGVTVDEFVRGVVDYHNDAYQLAIEAFERLRSSDPTGRKGEAWYYAGLSYLAMGQFDQAIIELGNFIAAYPDSPHWNDAWMAKARAQTRSDEVAAAVETYRQFAREHADAPQAPSALWQAANLAAQAGDANGTAQSYLEVARRYPQADEGWRAYLTAALTYFRAGNILKAGETWSEMAENSELPGWTRAVAYYWLGRAQSDSGETVAARHSWQLAAESAPDNFYGERAAARAAGAGPALFAPGSTRFPTDIDVDAGALADWLGSWAGAGSLALPSAITDDPDWHRGEALLTIGLRSSSLAAWERLQKRFADNAWAQAALALAFRDAGEHRLSISCAEQVAALAVANGTPAALRLPVALERLIYPLPFGPLIQEQAQKWNVDPLLVAALVRQESRFEAGATSTAVAQGLMQVIPDTADWIASQLGWQNFSAQQIYLPYVNVEFGTYYLHRQLEWFDNNVAAALAAYNGGPGNARTWYDMAPDDDDLLVASIGLSESRLYVQLVWQHYQAYLRLYPR